MRFSFLKPPLTANPIATDRVLAFKQCQRCDIGAECAFGGQDRAVNTTQVESNKIACGFLMLSVKHLNINGLFQTGEKVG